MKKCDIAYIAGVVDSDGYIGIKKSTYALRVRKDATQPVYCERIGIKQVEHHAVSLIKGIFGGCLSLEKPYTEKNRPMYAYSITNKKAAYLIRTILPYLRIKRKQAENAIRLRECLNRSRKLRGRSVRTLSISNEMEACFITAKWLNRTGPR